MGNLDAMGAIFSRQDRSNAILSQAGNNICDEQVQLIDEESGDPIPDCPYRVLRDGKLIAK
jgi:hypothetical protein